MPFHKILCPIDFSPGSQQAMRTAIRIAGGHGAELVLAYAWQAPAVAMGNEFGVGADTVANLTEDAERGLAEARKEAASLGAKRVSGQLLAGVARQAIVELAGADPAFDLIVMGTHGRSGVARVVLGSVAEAVVRYAPCPVLVVRGDGPDDRDVGPFSSILCPVDFSSSSKDALGLATELARPGGQGIELLQVIEAPFESLVDLPAETQREMTAQAVARLEAWAKDLVAQASQASQASVPIHHRVRAGRAGAQILAELDAGSFDLVVMGSHGRTGLDHMLLGSVSEKIVRSAHCSVLVARGRRA